MIADHIKFLKWVVEENMSVRDGTHIFAGKFYEVYPLPSTVTENVPCACLRHQPQRSKKNGTMDSSSATADTVTKIRRLYDTTHLYQVDFFSRDIYDFIPKDNTYKGWLDQFFEYIANNPDFAGENGENIQAECGVGGIIDTEELIVDGIYKGFCQAQFTDGIYASVTIPRITGIKFNEGGILNG